MRLKEQQSAIDFTARDFKGNTVRLHDYIGKKTLLIFFRFATCPYCNLRLHELINSFEAFDVKGLSVIAVFESSPENVTNYAGKQNAPFPIISDPRSKLYASYGLELSFWGLLKVMVQFRKLFLSMVTKGFSPKPLKIDSPIHRLPADFLIDENGVISIAHYGKDIGDHLTNNEINAFLDA